MLQALNHGKLISKELLWKDVRKEDREGKGEAFILDLIDWGENGDPFFYENHHQSPQLIENSRTGSGEHWIYYNTTKFSGKKLVVHPGCSYVTVDDGVYNILVWSGSGTYGGVEVEGGAPGRDELLVARDRAVAGVEVRTRAGTTCS